MTEIAKEMRETPCGRSHLQRARFERIAYDVALAIVVATALVVLFGIAYPPPPPDTRAADWGAAIVAKAATAVPVLLTLLGTLGGWIGISLARGAHDARLGGE